MKVLHVLYQSLPNLTGSSIRSRDIILSQKDAGLDVVVITSPFQRPFADVNSCQECSGGITYYRTFNSQNLEVTKEGVSTFVTKLRKAAYIFLFARKLLKITMEEKPDVLHAHATFFTAFATWYVSKKTNIPFVYEVRSLWDERQKQLARSKWEKVQIRLITWLENKAINSADYVIAINQKLRDVLLSRGIRKNITVVKNGVNFSLLPEKLLESTLEQKLTNCETITFGYIGSITFIEGLSFLVRAFKHLQSEPVRLFIYGSGPAVPELEEIIGREGIRNVSIKGSFSPDNVANVYDQVDCVINPRIRNKLSETVTPLKPLEALGYKKLFIGSNVGGISELIQDRVSGFLFTPEDEDSLVSTVKYVLNKSNAKEIKHIIDTGNGMVKEKFSWNANAKIYLDIYKGLAKSNRGTSQ